MMKKKYYRCRDGSFYTKYTKEELGNQINPYDFNTFKPFLKEMDYVCDEQLYENITYFVYKNNQHITRILPKYIAQVQLPAYRKAGYDDWEEKPSIKKKKIKLTY